MGSDASSVWNFYATVFPQIWLVMSHVLNFCATVFPQIWLVMCYQYEISVQLRFPRSGYSDEPCIKFLS